MHSYPLIHAQGFHNTFWAFSNIFHSFACSSVNCEWIVLNFVSDLELSKTEALQVISTWYHYSLIFNHVLKMKSFLNRPIIPALPYNTIVWIGLTWMVSFWQRLMGSWTDGIGYILYQTLFNRVMLDNGQRNVVLSGYVKSVCQTAFEKIQGVTKNKSRGPKS